MLPILQVGPLALPLPGLLVIVGLWLGVTLVEREARRSGLSADAFNSMMFYAILAGILGARLGYVLRFLEIYWEQPLNIFALNLNTFAMQEGLVAAVLVAMIYGRRKGLPLWRSLDDIALGVAVFSIFVALAHLSSGDAFGSQTSWRWGIELWGARRHPTQILEILLASLTVLWLQYFKTRTPYRGLLCLLAAGMMAGNRLLLETLRGDSVILWGGVRSAQVVSLTILILAALGIHILARRAVRGNPTAASMPSREHTGAQASGEPPTL